MPNGAYGKAGNGNETETGNWKWKLEMEIENGNGNKKRTNHWCKVFFIVCLYWRILYLAMVI